MSPDFETVLTEILGKYPNGERQRRRAAVEAELKRRNKEGHLSQEWYEIMRKAAAA